MLNEHRWLGSGRGKYAGKENCSLSALIRNPISHSSFVQNLLRFVSSDVRITDYIMITTNYQVIKCAKDNLNERFKTR